jgi:hypothetical protein
MLCLNDDAHDDDDDKLDVNWDTNANGENGAFTSNVEVENGYRFIMILITD